MWQPSATLNALRLRAELMARIRRFFAERDIFEVETPLLSIATVSDPHIASISALHQQAPMYLQTSPEYAMKRLLAAGSGSIYQISKAFRSGDTGRVHHPEFTLLEWYRIGFDHHALMDEMDQLLQCILKTPAAERVTMQALYQTYLKIDPHTATLIELQDLVKSKIDLNGPVNDRNTCLELLFSHEIEPHFSNDRPVFLYDFPISQAALAKIRPENPPVASRFEVYFKGLELANGFHELQDPSEQRARFERDLQYRRDNQLSVVGLDEDFLAALEHGLPDCSGVALGVDRLMMLALEVNTIDDVMSFIWSR